MPNQCESENDSVIPTIETERLRLRGWEMRDFEPYAALRTDAELQKYVGGAVTREQAWNGFCGIPGQWALRGLGVFIAAERESDRAVGYAGLWFPQDLEEPELCWSLFRGNTGKGYATEAAAAARRWAYEARGLPPLMSFVHPDNRPSQAVAERLGARRQADTTLRGMPRFFYRHPGPDGP